jgi:hypothetical protein
LLTLQAASPSIVRRPAGRVVAHWLREESQVTLSMDFSESLLVLFLSVFDKAFSAVLRGVYITLYVMPNDCGPFAFGKDKSLL